MPRIYTDIWVDEKKSICSYLGKNIEHYILCQGRETVETTRKLKYFGVISGERAFPLE